MHDGKKTLLTVSDVFARSATELEACVRIMRDIEALLLPVHAVSSTKGIAAVDGFQNFDLLVQTVEDIAILLAGLATCDRADGMLDAQHSLSRMRLFDLRQRIAGAGATDTKPVNRISFF